ncbi:MAG TPA: hypothetical protein VEI97_01615, partial [bacterium]|nr:hypothetical protein [bacterium]
MVWEKRLSGKFGGYENPTGVVVDGEGNVIVAGTSTSQSAIGERDWYIAKFAEVDGRVLWQRRYTGPDG